VLENMELALNVFVSSDVDTARQLMEEKDLFRELEQRSNLRHMQRLRQGSAESIESSSIHLDVIRDLAQVNSLLTSTAYPILEASGELLRSRLRSDTRTLRSSGGRIDGENEQRTSSQSNGVKKETE
jgi:phosphate:Na+ symporter